MMRPLLGKLNLYCKPRGACYSKSRAEYVQGQEPAPGIREYFYYVDHNGMLFLEHQFVSLSFVTIDLKEKKLLFNFFKRLKLNDTDRYPEFKYLSLCGRERNFVRCVDRPVVFSSVKLIQKGEGEDWYLPYNWADELLVEKFEPHMITMVPATGGRTNVEMDNPEESADDSAQPTLPGDPNQPGPPQFRKGQEDIPIEQIEFISLGADEATPALEPGEAHRVRNILDRRESADPLPGTPRTVWRTPVAPPPPPEAAPPAAAAGGQSGPAIEFGSLTAEAFHSLTLGGGMQDPSLPPSSTAAPQMNVPLVATGMIPPPSTLTGAQHIHINNFTANLNYHAATNSGGGGSAPPPQPPPPGGRDGAGGHAHLPAHPQPLPPFGPPPPYTGHYVAPFPPQGCAQASPSPPMYGAPAGYHPSPVVLYQGPTQAGYTAPSLHLSMYPPHHFPPAHQQQQQQQHHPGTQQPKDNKHEQIIIGSTPVVSVLQAAGNSDEEGEEQQRMYRREPATGPRPAHPPFPAKDGKTTPVAKGLMTRPATPPQMVPHIVTSVPPAFVPQQAAAQLPPSQVAQMLPPSVAQMPPPSVAQMPPPSVAQMPPPSVAQMPPPPVAQMPPAQATQMPPPSVAQMPPPVAVLSQPPPIHAAPPQVVPQQYQQPPPPLPPQAAAAVQKQSPPVPVSPPRSQITAPGPQQQDQDAGHSPPKAEEAAPPKESPPTSPPKDRPVSPPPAAQEEPPSQVPSGGGGGKSWASLLFNGAGGPGGPASSAKPTARIPPFSTDSDGGAGGVGSPRGPADPSLSAGGGAAGPSMPVLSAGPTQQDRELGAFLRRSQLNHMAPAFLPRGLTNRSNWCFVNAILQALLACPPFYNLMRAFPGVVGLKVGGGKSTTPMMDSIVQFVGEFSHLEAMNKTQKKDKSRKKDDLPTGTPIDISYVYNMLLHLESETFKVIDGRQEDAEEFLTFLLNGLSDEMLSLLKLTEEEQTEQQQQQQQEMSQEQQLAQQSGASGDEWQEVGSKGRSCVTRRVADSAHLQTPMQQLALGTCRSCVRSETGETSATLQPFFSLQLDIQSPSVSSVTDALLANFNVEKLDGYICSKTKQEVEATRSVSLEELPAILILHLKRFVYDSATGGCQKDMKPVSFSVDLEISKDILANKSKFSSKQKQYKLFAVVYHNGREATKGHYVTDVYHTGYAVWLRCDDSQVKPTSENLVVEPAPNSVPYILFYRRCDTMIGVEKTK